MTIHTILKHSFKLFITGILITSCSTEPRVNVDEISIPWNFSRMEQKLFTKTKSIDEKLPHLIHTYGEFFKRYTEDVLNLGAVGDPTLTGAYKLFVYDTDISTVYQDVQKEFASLDAEEKQLKDAFKRYHYYFPEKDIPGITTIISGFSYKIVTTEKNLGIALDMYMGADYPYYQAVQFPQFKKRGLDKKFIVADALTGWVSTEFERPDSNTTFLDEIIFEGKMLYLLDKLSPELADNVKIGYTADQLQWCKENEIPIWGHFVNKKLLYSKSKSEYFKYLNDGPFTSGFDRASPARTGMWIGWQIVRAYMSNHTEVSLEDLINNESSQAILNQSGYKPTK